MKKTGLYFVLFLLTLAAGAQTQVQPSSKRPASRSDINTMTNLADSVLKELKTLYKLEKKTNEPNKFQPERIALVRSYLLVYKHFEQTCDAVSYSKQDIIKVFGQPDRIIQTDYNQEDLIYENINKPYIRISNLKYRFSFKAKELIGVKRD